MFVDALMSNKHRAIGNHRLDSIENTIALEWCFTDPTTALCIHYIGWPHWHNETRCDNLNHQSGSFETSQDLTIILLVGYWNVAQDTKIAGITIETRPWSQRLLASELQFSPSARSPCKLHALMMWQVLGGECNHYTRNRRKKQETTIPIHDAVLPAWEFPLQQF